MIFNVFMHSGCYMLEADDAESAAWQGLRMSEDINDYLIDRENLIELFVLIDVRHEPQKIDLGFIEWLYDVEIPFSIIFTKADKLSKNKVASNVSQYNKILKKIFKDVPNYMVTSAEKDTGKETVLEYIDSNVTR